MVLYFKVSKSLYTKEVMLSQSVYIIITQMSTKDYVAITVTYQ